MHDTCGATSKAWVSRRCRTVRGVCVSVEPPAPKVTLTNSGASAFSFGTARSSCARCSSVLGGKNSREIGIIASASIYLSIKIERIVRGCNEQNETAGLRRRFGFIEPRSSGRFLPLPQRSQAVVARAFDHDFLRGGEVADQVLCPQVQRSLLHRAAVGERQRPRMRAEPVHGVQVRGRVFVALSAG